MYLLFIYLFYVFMYYVFYVLIQFLGSFKIMIMLTLIVNKIKYILTLIHRQRESYMLYFLSFVYYLFLFIIILSEFVCMLVAPHDFDLADILISNEQ